MTKQWFLQRRLVDLPYNLMCHYHMLIDVSNVWAYVFDLNDFLPTKLREVVSSIAVAALLAIELRRRLGRASGWFAALAWLLFPETIETGITNYIDMSLGLYFLATMVVLSRTLEPGRRRARKFAIELVWHACLTYDIESFQVRQLVEEQLQLPYLKITTDYSPADSARLAARVQALVETVQARG